jgi:hypothetical protein
MARRPLLARTALPSFVLLFSAWLVSCDRTTFSTIEDGSAGAGGTGGAASGSAGSLSFGVAGSIAPSIGPQPCQLASAGEPVFAAHAFGHDTPARRELYTWTTAEQVQELRAGSVLLTRSERAGLGPGYAMELMAARAALGETSDPNEADARALARLLTSPAFSKARYLWSEPWATRMGWPGESYSDELVRVRLRADAWLVRYYADKVDVVDMANAPVATAEALAHPERVAGVYFVKDGTADGPRCGGSFRSGDDGYREFIIGNEAMIEEWSLGTLQIRERIEADIERVQAFFDRIRPCPSNRDAHSWNLDVVCGWSYVAPSELGAYEASLAMPSPAYLPQVPTLVALLEALEASLFEPVEPFVVEPGQ